MQQFNLILSTTLAVFTHWWKKNWRDQEGGHPTPLNNHNVHSKLVLAEGLYKTSIYHQMRKWMEDKKIYLGHWSRTSFLTIFWFVLKASYIHFMSWNISLKQGGELFNGRPLSPNVCWNLIAKTSDAVHSCTSNDCSTFCGNDCNIYFWQWL